MKCVDLSCLDVGLLLAQPVYNHQGDLLFEAGSVLTDKDVRVLKSWGIDVVWVQKETKEGSFASGEDSPTKEIEDFSGTTLEEKFSNVLENPIMAVIMRAAKKIQERRHSKLNWDNDHQ